MTADQPINPRCDKCGYRIITQPHDCSKSGTHTVQPIKPKIRISKKGKLFISPFGHKVYRVFKWEEYEDGKIRAIIKQVEKQEDAA